MYGVWEMCRGGCLLLQTCGNDSSQGNNPQDREDNTSDHGSHLPEDLMESLLPAQVNAGPCLFLRAAAHCSAPVAEM